MDSERKLCVSAIEKDNIIQTNYLHILIDLLYCLPKAIVITIIYEYIPQYSGETLEDIIDVYDLVHKYHELKEVTPFYIMKHICDVLDEIYIMCSRNIELCDVYVIDKKNKLIIRKISIDYYEFMDVYKNEIFLCSDDYINIIDKYSGKFIGTYVNEAADYDISAGRNVTSCDDKIYFLDFGDFGYNDIHVFDKNTKKFNIIHVKVKCNEESMHRIAKYDNIMYTTTRHMSAKIIKLDHFDIMNPTKITSSRLDRIDCDGYYLPTDLIVTDNEIFINDYLAYCIHVLNKFDRTHMRKIEINKHHTRPDRIQIMGDKMFVKCTDNKIYVYKRIKSHSGSNFN
jgi:hypothetical protein